MARHARAWQTAVRACRLLFSLPVPIARLVYMALPQSNFFPPAESADADGLIGVGGELTPDWLLDAYCHGIFPWPISNDEQHVAWWSPDPRAVFELDQFHASRRLLRTDRSGKFRVTFDKAFAAVMDGCATAQDRAHGTWITAGIHRGYRTLHALGHAHSVEVWLDDKLVGGTYGVHLGGMFAGESMFHLATDASKIALLHLVRRLKAKGFLLFDIQQLTPHTASLGAGQIPRGEYLKRLEVALALPVKF